MSSGAAGNTKQRVFTDAVAAPGGIWSQAIEVSEPGRMLFVSGLTARDADGSVFGEGDIEAQTERVLESLSAVLATAGGTLDDIVKVTVFVRDIDCFDTIHAVRKRFFTEPYPASSMVEVSRLVDPRSLIEIEAIAVLPPT
jgi:2-iminobutanoate/2-iminopropanoate deaminase